MFFRQVLESMKKAYSEVFEGIMLSLGPGDAAYSLGDIPATHNTKFLVCCVECVPNKWPKSNLVLCQYCVNGGVCPLNYRS